MFIFLIIIVLVTSKSEQDELREAACVIFSRYVLQIQTDVASPYIGKLIHQFKVNHDEAIQTIQAPLLDICLKNIKQREVTKVLDALQEQQIELEKYTHLYQGVKYDRFYNGQEGVQKNKLLTIIKEVEELIATQWQKNPEVENQRKQELIESEELDLDFTKGFEQVEVKSKIDIKNIKFEQIWHKNKEYFYFSLFILVPFILFLNCCCRTSNKKNKSNKSDQQNENKQNQQKEKEKEKEKINKKNNEKKKEKNE